ncbi:MAG: 4-hydroxy-3-methylbut-2-enyl diphosphate reductase [candidate division Zixibacteria bacterium]|nr:4-hydroxy-3-methylbut-2-enyl diphosphate reductase [candidate division Zixibacteria bacterium]
MIKKIIIARHQGFCMGVKRAINIAEETARDEDGKVTIMNEIVHNEAVVSKFLEKGVGQSSSLDDINDGVLIISAHGVAPDIKENAASKGLKVVDATCPLVERIYQIIEKAVDNDFHIIHYGEPGHDETQGIIGHAPNDITVASNKEELLALPNFKNSKLGLTVQTTAHQESFNDIVKLAKEKWPHIQIFNTICNATTQRQSAILDLSPKVDMVLVVGSKSSANSNRLAQIADAITGNGILISSANDIQLSWFKKNIEKVGISAGASTPQFLVDETIERLIQISDGKAEVILPERRNKKK